MKLNDCLNGAVFLVLASVILFSARDLPALPGQRFGPALFPTIIGIAMAGAALILMLRGVRSLSAGPLVDLSEWRGKRRILAAGVWVVAGLVATIVWFDAVGFVPLATLYAAGIMVLLGVTIPRAVVYSLAVSLVAFFAFTRLLYVPLPVGPLEFLR